MQKNITRLSFKSGTLPYTSWCRFLFLHLSSKWRIPEDAGTIIPCEHHSSRAVLVPLKKKITSWILFCTFIASLGKNPTSWCLLKESIMNSRHSNSINSVPSWNHLAFHFFIFQMMGFEHMNSKLTWWTLLFIFCERNIFDYWFSYK